MRPPKALTTVCLFLFLTQNVGCVSFQPLRSDLPTDQAATRSDPVVRVTSREGERWKLVNVFSDSLNVRGHLSGKFVWEDPEEVAIPTIEIVRIEERRFSLTRTLLLVGTGVGLLAWGMSGVLDDMRPFGEGSLH